MPDKENGVAIRDCILKDIEPLMKVISISKRDKDNKYSQESLMMELGIIVGELDAHTLCILYNAYPELDNLKNNGIL